MGGTHEEQQGKLESGKIVRHTLIFFKVDFRPIVATESIVRLAAVLLGDCGVVEAGPLLPLLLTKTPPGPGGLRCTPSVCLFRW